MHANNTYVAFAGTVRFLFRPNVAERRDVDRSTPAYY